MATSDVHRRLSTARAQGADIVRFGGGEPLMDRRLVGFVSYARDLGYSHVEVETNATLALLSVGEVTYLDRLCDAGLTRAWVALMSADADDNDRWTQDSGGSARSWASLDALAQRKMKIGLSVAVFPENTNALGTLVDAVHSRIGSCFDSIRFFVVHGARVSFEQLERGLFAGCARARHHRIDYRFEPTHAPPPCVFSPRFVNVHSPLYASYYLGADEVRDGRKRIDACNGCGFRDRCSGHIQSIVSDHPESIPTAPLDEEAVAALKGQLGGVSRHQASQVSVVRLVGADGATAEKPNLRVAWACNQRCRFCWVDFNWAPPPKDKVFEQLAQLAQAGHRRVSLTGGEPTLVPWILDVICHARELGFRWIQLQTNGTLIQTQELATKFANHGLTEALVSLHSHQPEISDGITQAPDTWQRTVVAIDYLVVAGVRTSISHVLTARNLADTSQFVAMVADRWARSVGIVWSVAAPITVASSRYDDSVPPMDDAGRALMVGLERCVELGVDYHGQNDTCGVPRCVLGHDPRFVVDISPEIADESGFIHPEICTPCRYKDGCRGVRKGYFSLYGDRGLVPAL